MLLRKRPVIFVGLLLLALSAFVYTAPRPSSGAVAQRRTTPSPTPDRRPPTVIVNSDVNVVTLCPDDEGQANSRVPLRAAVSNPDNVPIRSYRWTTTGGRVEGEGADVVWDLTGAAPGTYTASVDVAAGEGVDPLCNAFASTKVIVRNCPPAPPVCPNVSIYCPDVVNVGEQLTFNANLSGGTAGVTPAYDWTVSPGTILNGQGTASITVDTTTLGGQSVTARLAVGGYSGLNCAATCLTQVKKQSESSLVDRYFDIARDDEKARLDNFAIALQNEPGGQGYIIVYPGRRSRPDAAQKHLDFAKSYLVNVRGIDSSRIVTLTGGQRDQLTTELWVAPSGANPPVPR